MAHYYASLTARQLIPFTSTKYYKELYSKTYPIQSYCFSYLSLFFDDLIDKIYSDDINLDKNAKENIENLVERMKDSFEQLLNENSWMDPTTKKFAKEKLLAIKSKVAAPDIVFDEKQLEREYNQVISII